MASSETSCLPRSFYQSDKVTELAKSLLGCCLFTSKDGLLTGGIIAETEAYAGVSDRASHAFGGRYTARTSIMYQMGGVAYVYLCYGMHQMFNVVSGPKGVPHAILIRGIVPLIGIETIQQRMGTVNNNKPLLINGPGKVCKALGIDRDFNGASLSGSKVWITEKMTVTVGIEILSTKRVGVDYAGEDALLPWRFVLGFDGYQGVTLKKADL